MGVVALGGRIRDFVTRFVAKAFAVTMTTIEAIHEIHANPVCRFGPTLQTQSGGSHFELGGNRSKWQVSCEQPFQQVYQRLDEVLGLRKRQGIRKAATLAIHSPVVQKHTHGVQTKLRTSKKALNCD